MSVSVWGKAAYDAYLDWWANKPGVMMGIQWPDWEELEEDEKEAWSVAAQAVREAVKQ